MHDKIMVYADVNDSLKVREIISQKHQNAVVKLLFESDLIDFIRTNLEKFTSKRIPQNHKC